MLRPHAQDRVDHREEFAIPDDGTMEVPLDEGTLSTSSRVRAPVPPGSRPGLTSRWRVWSPLAILAGTALLLGGSSHLERPIAAPDAVEELRMLLSEHPGADVGVRRLYAERLLEAGRPADAFEEYLAVVRVEPLGRGRDALFAATFVARDLARLEPGVGLWTERHEAAADRFARYWSDDPISAILLEDATMVCMQ